MSLISEIHKEIGRNKQILKEYEAIPEGVFGAMMIKKDILRAEKSLESGEVTEMVISLKTLKETK